MLVCFIKELKMCSVYSCIVFVLCSSFVLAKFDESILTDDLKKLMNTLHKTCVDETGVNEADVDKLRTGKFPDNDKIKCYVKCVMSESGAMDDNGQIDLKALTEVVPEELKETIKKEFESCTKKGEGLDDHCEKAYTILKCVHDEDPDTFYFA